MLHWRTGIRANTIYVCKKLWINWYVNVNIGIYNLDKVKIS